ncbi:transporter [Paenibacillus baekrokdamisoli]|uniref:Transporter n=1 Tax=Paenibacillus baekrokdamisoli TaxID=1712516 RepID=A0A3G9JQ60_9BACL|nr:carbohydrate ABC transporter permease [Paenibacillus baekrokdamisoli]MBB3069463.1 multiple sugar transport system permease protein [Paenibacillus baekrokdamisoli]BBH24964.1 transporter [Paenibacillus baekrokdamisoli]
MTNVTRSLLSPKLWIKVLWVLVRSALLIGICYVILYPILLKLSIAFKDWSDVTNPRVIWVPENFTLNNFKQVIAITCYGHAALNTFMLASLTTVLQTASCALAGYAFARLHFKGRSIVFALVVLTIVVPPQTLMVPTYLHFRYFDVLGLISLFTGKEGVNILGSYWPFVLMAVTGMGLKNGLFIFIFRQVFRSIPKEIEEASLVDGGGFFKTFYRIMLPNAIPAMITVMLFSFVWQWNDTYYSSMFLTNTNILSTQLINLPATMEHYFRSQGTAYDPTYGSMLQNTYALLVIAPLIFLYLFAQRHFVEGIERSGIVG